jgi:hypothetical protein
MRTATRPRERSGRLETRRPGVARPRERRGGCCSSASRSPGPAPGAPGGSDRAAAATEHLAIGPRSLSDVIALDRLELRVLVAVQTSITTAAGSPGAAPGRAASGWRGCRRRGRNGRRAAPAAASSPRAVARRADASTSRPRYGTLHHAGPLGARSTRRSADPQRLQLLGHRVAARGPRGGLRPEQVGSPAEVTASQLIVRGQRRPEPLQRCALGELGEEAPNLTTSCDTQGCAGQVPVERAHRPALRLRALERADGNVLQR